MCLSKLGVAFLKKLHRFWGSMMFLQTQ